MFLSASVDIKVIIYIYVYVYVYIYVCVQLYGANSSPIATKLRQS